MTRGAEILSGAATGFYKAAEIVSGAAVKLYKGAVIVGGQAVQIFKSAIEWTYAITETHADALYYFKNYSYGNNGDLAAFVYGEDSSDYYYAEGTCKVVYTFSEPLKLKAGQTIRFESATGGHVGRTSLTFDNDSSPIHSWYGADGGGFSDSEDYTYTLPADRTVSFMTALANVIVSTENNGGCNLKVTINSSDFESFLLNNSGTSENQ